MNEIDRAEQALNDLVAEGHAEWVDYEDELFAVAVEITREG